MYLAIIYFRNALMSFLFKTLQAHASVLSRFSHFVYVSENAVCVRSHILPLQALPIIIQMSLNFWFGIQFYLISKWNSYQYLNVSKVEFLMFPPNWCSSFRFSTSVNDTTFYQVAQTRNLGIIFGSSLLPSSHGQPCQPHLQNKSYIYLICLHDLIQVMFSSTINVF